MTVAAVERAFRLLRAVPETDGTLSSLSRRTGLAVATVSRLMGTLEQTGAVVRDDKVYRIGPAVRELADAQPVTYDLVSLATVHLNALVAETGETAGLAAPIGHDHVHLAQVAADHDVTVRDWTGFRVGCHAGCTGFVLMAYWPQSEVDDYLGRDLEAFSSATVTEPDVILARLQEIRERGWLWTTDEYALGVTTVAAAVLDRDGRAVGSLYVHGPSYRFPPPGRRPAIGALVRDRANLIGEVLGHRSRS